MLNDRLLVRIPERDGERRSTGGILIPATAQISKRLVWAEVVALGRAGKAKALGFSITNHVRLAALATAGLLNTI